GMTRSDWPATCSSGTRADSRSGSNPPSTSPARSGSPEPCARRRCTSDMKWFLALLVILAMVAAGCAGQPVVQPPPPAPPAAPAAQVYVRVAAEPSFWAIDSRTGQVARTLPSGTPSPDWRWLYRLTGGALDVVDPTTGRVTSTHSAPSWADAVRTSA